MGENVFILGAGASAESGGPLMNTFLDVAEDLWCEGKFGEHSERIKSVFDARISLRIVFEKSSLKLNNIEDLFGAIEMARIIDKLGEYSSEQIRDVRNALVTLIVKTLEKAMKFHDVEYDKTILPPRPYRDFARLLKAKGIGTSSIITFNYDIALDFALEWDLGPINYCLDDENSSNVKVLKLHGSINWGRCLTCNNIVPYKISNFEKDYGLGPEGMIPATFPLSEKLKDLSKYHNHKEFENIPVIVPPTWNKTEYQGAIARVWKEAAKELSLARNIYVFGYSLPETDLFFRYLFALGTIGTSIIRRFWVFDLEPERGNLQKRYEALIGQGIRDRFEYINMIFSRAIFILAEKIGLRF
jgi:NAD-dependent SIR2 family protein deacetylase